MKCGKVFCAIVISAAFVCGCAGKADSSTDVSGALFSFEEIKGDIESDDTEIVVESEEKEETEEDSSVVIVSQRNLTGDGEDFSQVTYIPVDEIASLYEDRITVSDAFNFEGDWERVELESDSAGAILISDQNEEGFSFEGFFVYTTRTGECEGTAYFVSSDTAVSCIDEGAKTYMAFRMVDGTLYVSHIGDFSSMGLDVTPDGEYLVN